MDANVQRTVVMTDLPEVLETFDQKLFFTRIPLLVLVLQIAGIVLYYLFMVSTMLVERQQSEISLFKSRGADDGAGHADLRHRRAGDPGRWRWRWGRRWPRWSSGCWGARRRSPTCPAAPTSASTFRRRRTSGRPAGRCCAYLMLLVPAYRATSTHRRAATHRLGTAAEAGRLHALLPRPRPGRHRRHPVLPAQPQRLAAHGPAAGRPGHRPREAADAGVLHPHGRPGLPAAVPDRAAAASPGWWRACRAPPCSSACGSSCATRRTTRASCCC